MSWKGSALGLAAIVVSFILMMGIGTLRSQAQAPLTREVIVPSGSGGGTAPCSAGIKVGNIIYVSGQTSGDAGPGIREQAQASLRKVQAIR